MKPGQVIGPATLDARVSQAGPLARFRAHSDDGELLEVLVLDSDCDANTRRHFERAHGALATPHHADVLRTDWVGTSEGGAAVAVRAWTEPLELPRDAARAEALLRALFAPIRTASEALLATTTPRDLRRAADGRPVVAPMGITLPSDGPHAAPEAHRDAPVGAEAGLYGLGAALYQALTQHTPLPTGLRTDEGDAIAATSWRPDLPYNLTQALAALLSRQPAERATAVERLDRAAPPATIVTGDVKLSTRATDGSTAVVTSRNARRDERRDKQRAVVAVSAADLRRLTPAEASRLAGWAGLPLSAVYQQRDRGEPLTVRTTATRNKARRVADELQRDADLPVEVLTPPSLLTAALLASLALAGTGAFALGAVFGVLWLTLAAATVFLVGLAGSALWLRTGAQFRRALAANARTALPSAAAPRLRAAIERLATLRRQVAALNLPDAAEADVRGSLRAIEERLDQVAALDRAVAEALAATQPDELRDRLALATRNATHDPSAARERDNIARVLSDVEAVLGRRDAIAAQLDDIHGALDALDTSLPTARLHDAEPVLEQIQRGVTAARARVKEHL